jgi:hypothetical protein
VASHEIAPLKCPSCGSSMTGPTKPLAFGAEFSCTHCGSTSVLIINRAMLPVDALQRSGDQVCAACGRVAKVDARFCQDGHKLVRTCLRCAKELAAHHQRCDYCGWPQDVENGTPEADELDLDRAIADLSDAALPGRPNYGPRALSTIATMWRERRRGKRAVASIISLLQTVHYKNSSQAWFTLATFGADAAEAVPLLLQRINELPNDQRFCGELSLCKVLAVIAPERVLPLCRNAIEANGKNLTDNVVRSPNLVQLQCVLETTKFVGKPAVPMLLEFCGFLSGRRGTECQHAIDEISKRGRLTWGYYWSSENLGTSWVD